MLAIEMSACTGLYTDRDHRLKVLSQGRRIDFGVEAADHSPIDERPHAAQAGRRGDTGGRGQGIVGYPRIP